MPLLSRLLPLGAVLFAVECTDTVPLGSWGRVSSSGGVGTAIGAGGAGDGGAGNGEAGAKNGDGGSSSAGEGGEAGNRGCTRAGGTQGQVNAGTAEVGATLTTTDWTFASRADSMEIDLTIEEEPPPGGDGYLWSYQFGFSGNPGGGFVGLQANGAFLHPDTNVTDYKNRLAVFWIAGPPIKGEFGDILDPLALQYAPSKFGTTWLAINAIYPWESCRTYRLRVARQSVENGDIWYGAWITDTVTNVRTQIGRILVDGAWGQLSASSSSWCDRIGWAQPTSCSALQHVSATWGFPSASVTNGSPFSLSTKPGNHFGSSTSPLRCPSSRFTEFADGMRQESGMMP